MTIEERLHQLEAEILKALAFISPVPNWRMNETLCD